MKSILFFIILCLPASLQAQQTMRLEGTHAPVSAVLKLVDDYSRSFDGNATVTQRDAKRKQLVSQAYFYHGMDGASIGLEGLTKRQAKNQFKLIDDSVYDKVLYQYENTAILIFKEWQHLVDKGVEKKATNSVLIVMGKENSEWKVLTDIIGQKPKEAPAIEIIPERN